MEWCRQWSYCRVPLVSEKPRGPSPSCASLPSPDACTGGLTLDCIDRIGRKMPMLVDLKSNSDGYMEDFHRTGVPALLALLAEDQLLLLDALIITGLSSSPRASRTFLQFTTRRPAVRTLHACRAPGEPLSARLCAQSLRHLARALHARARRRLHLPLRRRRAHRLMLWLSRQSVLSLRWRNSSPKACWKWQRPWRVCECTTTLLP